MGEKKKKASASFEITFEKKPYFSWNTTVLAGYSPWQCLRDSFSSELWEEHI